MSYGMMIKKIRRRLEMTQEEFGQAIGYTQSAVCSWENDSRDMSIKAEAAIKRYLGKRGLRVPGKLRD